MSSNICRYVSAVVIALPLCTAASDGHLTLTIITQGLSYQAKQPLGGLFNHFNSGVMATAQGITTREYMAIRCDEAWGAFRYPRTLSVGPGYSLQLSDNGELILRILEYAVISQDAAINAMAMHCIELEPRPVVNTIAKIKLVRNAASSQQLELANGYSLSYHYVPTTTIE
ncbi:MAG: hypothetical protein K0U59_04390 [Gammaproteobacteria bacterium]|nr:hypothetical protein [Gammaproteobacteria bacterium]